MQLVVVSAVSAAVSAATNIFASNSRIRFFVIVCCNFCVGSTYLFSMMQRYDIFACHARKIPFFRVMLKFEKCHKEKTDLLIL